MSSRCAAKTCISVPDEHATIITSRGHCAVSRAHEGHIFYGLPADVAAVAHHIPLQATHSRHNCLCRATRKRPVSQVSTGMPFR